MRWTSSEKTESPEAVERGETDKFKQLQKNWLIILAYVTKNDKWIHKKTTRNTFVRSLISNFIV